MIVKSKVKVDNSLAKTQTFGNSDSISEECAYCSYSGCTVKWLNAWIDILIFQKALELF